MVPIGPKLTNDVFELLLYRGIRTAHQIPPFDVAGAIYTPPLSRRSPKIATEARAVYERQMTGSRGRAKSL